MLDVLKREIPMRSPSRPVTVSRKAFGVRLTGRGVVETAEGPDHYRTNAEKVFTAGDMHRGQSLVVWNIVEGRGCAREVDEFLMGYTSLREQ